MTIRQVREVPAPRYRPQESFVAKDVREFLRLGYDAAAFEYPGRDAKSIRAALASYIKKNPKTCSELAVCVRGGDKGTCYLYRRDV